MLTAAIPLILRQRDAVFCFIGRGSSRGGQKLAGLIGQDAAPVVVTDDLSATDAAAHIAACDVMLLPYPDGVTTRRSSTVAALALGTPVVSTVGALTEPLWAESSVVGLADSPASAARMTCEVLDDSAKRADLSRRSRVLYEQSFSVSQTVRRLRGGNREGVQ
jgi:glycosyltransferase involved in cell wall biosynthesis